MSSIKIASATELWIILCIITSHTLGEKLIFPSSVIRFRWPWKWEKWFFLFFFAVFSLTIRWYLLFHALLQALWLVSLSHENSLSFWLSIFIKRKLIQIAKFLLFFDTNTSLQWENAQRKVDDYFLPDEHDFMWWLWAFDIKRMRNNFLFIVVVFAGLFSDVKSSAWYQIFLGCSPSALSFSFFKANGPAAIDLGVFDSFFPLLTYSQDIYQWKPFQGLSSLMQKCFLKFSQKKEKIMRLNCDDYLHAPSKKRYKTGWCETNTTMTIREQTKARTIVFTLCLLSAASRWDVKRYWEERNNKNTWEFSHNGSFSNVLVTRRAREW